MLSDFWDLRKYPTTGWIFRGHCDSNYELQSSLERLCTARSEWNLSSADKLEDVLEREFIRHYHHYATLLHDEEDHLQWYSIMQHHGAPTRLLDFTYSVWIAAYFALEEAVDDKGNPRESAIWALNDGWVNKTAAKMYDKDSQERKYIEAQLDRKDEDAFKKIAIGEDSKKLVLIVNPFRRNERLSIQKGVFACPGDVSAPFVENLKALSGWGKKENLVCLKIPPKMRNDGLRALYSMGISRTSLFPGLDGFSQSLHYAAPLIWKDIIEHKIKL